MVSPCFADTHKVSGLAGRHRWQLQQLVDEIGADERHSSVSPGSSFQGLDTAILRAAVQILRLAGPARTPVLPLATAEPAGNFRQV